jgi:hypothetical protein
MKKSKPWTQSTSSGFEMSAKAGSCHAWRVRMMFSSSAATPCQYSVSSSLRNVCFLPLSCTQSISAPGVICAGAVLPRRNAVVIALNRDIDGLKTLPRPSRAWSIGITPT